MKQLFMQVISPVNSGTRFYHLQTAITNDYNYAQGTTVESSVQLIMGYAGTLKMIRIDLLGNAPGDGKSWAITVNKNGVATGLTATISGSETGKKVVQNVTYEVGDKLSIQATPSGLPAATTMSITVESETASAGYSMVSGGFMTNTSSIYGPFANYINNNNTIYSNYAHNVQAPMNFTIIAIYVQLVTAPGAGKSRTLSVRNGTSVLETVAVGGTDTEANKTGLSIAITQGDTLNCRMTPAGGPAASIMRYSILIQATINGESFVAIGHGGADLVDSKYNLMLGTRAFGQTTSRANYCSETGFILKNLFQRNDLIGAEASRALTVYKNGEATALTCQVIGQGYEASNTADTAVFSEDDYGEVFCDTTGDTGAGLFTMTMYIPSTSPKGLPTLFAG